MQKIIRLICLTLKYFIFYIFIKKIIYLIENNTRLNSHTFKLLGSQSRYLPVLTPFAFLETKQKLEEIYGCKIELKPEKTEPFKENFEEGEMKEQDESCELVA